MLCWDALRHNIYLVVAPQAWLPPTGGAGAGGDGADKGSTAAGAAAGDGRDKERQLLGTSDGEILLLEVGLRGI
jgi:hypothetical protein